MEWDATALEVGEEVVRKGSSCKEGREVEARVGMERGGRFVTGTTKSFLDSTILMLESSPDVDSSLPWVEEQDYHYSFNPSTLTQQEEEAGEEGGGKGKRGRELSSDSSPLHPFFSKCKQTGTPSLKKKPTANVRTRVRCDDTTLSLTTETVQKQRLGSVDLKIGPLLVRVSSAKEEVVEPPPIVYKTHLVRIKQRRRFLLKPRSESLSPTWAFDVSLMWIGSTRSEAEKKQRSQDPDEYHVECECVSDSYLDSNPPSYVFKSLILKMRQLLMEEDWSCPVSIFSSFHPDSIKETPRVITP